MCTLSTKEKLKKVTSLQEKAFPSTVHFVKIEFFKPTDLFL